MTKIEKKAKAEIYLISSCGDQFQISEFSEHYNARTYSRNMDKWAALAALTTTRAEFCERNGQSNNHYRRMVNRGSVCRENARA